LVTTFGGSTIPVFSRLLRPTQPGHPSVGRCKEYTGGGFGHCWERNSEFCIAVALQPGLLASWLKSLAFNLSQPSG